ncbi:hypothetical protein IWW47_000396 [Coemansia sp. RSA 2052]|nr:hypothetical protein IWW47_000396 [Coemansia sp. RSA 2052]
MASLTDVFPPGIGDYNALSNRELRFAVENHMLVEQHRYLIRDLGHARSAIAALKQVVQAKEERFESYELANVELQQRVALLESMLTPEQRQQLACMPYAFNMCSVSSSSSHQSLRSQPAAHDVPGDEGAEAPLQPPDLDEPCGGSGSGAGFALATSSAAAAAAEARRNNGRPLSGYVTGYSFNDKPVGHLPRVFSGDYSAANVQAMETSVEALANAIAAMPRDEATVEDIIASKMPEKQSGANSSASAADNDDDASPHHPQPQPPPGAAGSKAKQHSAADHPRQPKRRSRFFSALRLSSFNGAVASAAPVAGEMGNRSRRSVSLGSTQRPAAAGVADQHQQQQPATMTMTPGGYSEAEAETAASCPTLLIPGITGGQPRSATVQRTARRQASADSFGSAAGAGGGRYPASLGLASGGGGGSDKASSRRVASGVSSGVSSCEDDEPHARQPQRLSFTPQPRRSTSAPSSRPQSMRVASRRSWLLQLFGSSSSSSAGGGGEPPVTEAASAEAAAAGGLWQRRRVMTQSSTEVAQLLGALQLSGEPAGAAAHGGGGPLEDVADVSGEDEERAARPSLSVAEIRQQTLDALNGTLPRVVQPVQPPMRILSLPHAGAAAAAALGAADDDDEPPEPPAVGSRWRQRESSVPTIMRLNPPPALLPAAATASLGLGVSVARRGSLPTTALTPLAGLIAGAGSPPPSDRRSQAQSPPGGGEGGGGGAPDDAANGKRWAPAFWAPPPPPVLSPAAANHQTTWASPRDSADSFESASMASRLSDDARQQPMAARGSLSLRHRRGGSSSPWEMVRAAESRTTFSPTHSRPGTPPPPQSSARSLGFFEDSTVVPDSDELLATAARRSLSLRMSRNAFKQAEPLPEADDAPDAPSSSSSSSSSPALSMAEASSAMLAPPGTSSSPAPPRNNALARVAADAAAQPKRRSLLWQFNSKHSHPSHPPRSDCASVASSDDKTAPPSVAAAAADNDDLLLLKDTCVMTSVVTAAAAAPPKRPKKWWSAVLG